MKVAVVYCYPLLATRTYFPLAMRFGETWRRFSPGHETFSLHVVCNGGSPTEMDKRPFAGIPCEYHVNDNIGWDIGAFQMAADHIPCDLLVCLGAPVHFYREGWLDRMVAAWLENGDGIYGCWGVPFRAHHHIRTTAFWITPQLLRSYPYTVGSKRSSRYEFEHGPDCITAFVERAGFAALMATWTGVYGPSQWGDADGGIGQCLLFDQFTHR